MFIPKWLLMQILDNQRDMERRIKRIEKMILNDAKQKISQLSGKDKGDLDESLLTIEEIIQKTFE